MKTFSKIWISPNTMPDGRRSVVGLTDSGWHPAGMLMPEAKNHVKEQPTNRWKQYVIDRAAESRANA